MLTGGSHRIDTACLRLNPPTLSTPLTLPSLGTSFVCHTDANSLYPFKKIIKNRVIVFDTKLPKQLKNRVKPQCSITGRVDLLDLGRTWDTGLPVLAVILSLLQLFKCRQSFQQGDLSVRTVRTLSTVRLDRTISWHFRFNSRKNLAFKHLMPFKVR